MALITFFSAKGAPGATSTAMLVAAVWPRPTLLVDADGAGGDVLMRLPAESGVALTQHPGLLTLLPLARHGLAPGVVLDHSQVVQGGQRVLVGLESPEQADASAALWPTLARAFREIPGTDVIIDAGQLTPRSGQLALAQRSDLVVGVVRPSPASVMHMRERLVVLQQTFAGLGADAPRVGVLAISDVQRPEEASAAIATVRAESTDVVDLGQVAHDIRAERMFHGEPVSRPERTMLVRSGRSLVQRLTAALGPGLAPPPPANRAEAKALAHGQVPSSEDLEDAPSSETDGAEPEVAAPDSPDQPSKKRKKWSLR